MGLSRRQFTKEFKLAAVRRLEQGVSIAEVARALEVNPNVLHRWRREFRHGPGNAFPGNGKQRWSEGRIAELERKVGQQAAGDRFFEGMLAAHRGAADAAGIDWKSAVYRKVQEEVKADRGLTIERMVELGRVSRSGFYRFDEDGHGGAGRGHGSARRHPTHRPGVAELRTAADHRRIAAARLDGEPEAGVPHPAGRQSAVRAETQVRRHHRLQPRPEGLSEPGRQDGGDRCGPTLGGRHHLHPACRTSSYSWR